MLLLKFGAASLVNANVDYEYSPLCLSSTSSVFATKVLLAVGANLLVSNWDHLFPQFLVRTLRRDDLVSVDTTIEALCCRRQRLHRPARTHSPQSLRHSARNDHIGVLDKEASRVSAAVREAKIHVPLAYWIPDKQTTVYHLLNVTAGVTPKLYDSGFVDTNGEDD